MTLVAQHLAVNGLEQSQSQVFRDAVIRGLSQSPKMIPSKFLYDRRGSLLFDCICELEEYYPTRTELALMDRHGPEMAERIGRDSCVVEFGSGSGKKTRILLGHLDGVRYYVPVDISKQFLIRTAERLADEFPAVQIVPVFADFSEPFRLPDEVTATENRLVYFPGSTIGNFLPARAAAILRRMARISGEEGSQLIGVDLKKDMKRLNAAYNDSRGMTASFNTNLLLRMNRELGTEIDLDAFQHRAFYDPEAGRVEMQLVSLVTQTIRIGSHSFRLHQGEPIRTEYSYKYDLGEFASLARMAGLRVECVWQDAERLFSVQLLRSESSLA